jgi:hypothetical protein
MLLKEMAPVFLPLTQIDRMLRAEAGSIYRKEFASTEIFTAKGHESAWTAMLNHVFDVSLVVSKFTRLSRSVVC